jgi:hypothetical protein
MEKQFSPAARIYLSLLAITGWFALIGQFYLIMINNQASVGEIIVRYFTFYTILTNILIAAGSTCILLKPGSEWGKFFSKATTLTAIAVNIIIVGATYNAILRFLWKPQGMQQVVDELLHLVIPVAFILFWLIFVPRGRLKWRNIFIWMIYPLAYLVVILIRGAMSGYYPYPFVDVSKLGYPQTLLNSLGITAAFIAVALLLVWVDRLMGKNALKA